MTEFVNPYNFIPFGDGPELSSLREEYGDPGKLNYGWMDVLLTTRQPVIIPGKVIKDENGHKTYDVFRFPDGSAGIPGSSLRGMIRSVYEAASDSCLPFVMNGNDVTLRTPTYASFKQRGLIGFDKEAKAWRLYKAVKFVVDDPIYTNSNKLNSVPGTSRLSCVIKDGYYWADPTRTNAESRYENGQKVRFSIIEGFNVMLDPDGDQEGWLQFNVPPALAAWDKAAGKVPEYHVCILVKGEEEPFFECGDEAEAIKARHDLYDDILKTLNASISEDRALKPFCNDKGVLIRSKRFIQWHENKTTIHLSLLDALLRVESTGDGLVPVWYETITKSPAIDAHNHKDVAYYLSPASIGRVSMHRKWEKIMGRYAPCTHKKQEQELALCPACRLFGNVREDSRGEDIGFSTRGRLRFSDATAFRNMRLCNQPQDLRILAQPKPSAYEFYLEKPNGQANYWNYDYYIIKRNDGADYYYWSDPKPRGRKMYWHGDRLYKLARPQDSLYGNSKLNASFHAFEKDSVFEFRIFFDGITDDQMKELQWVLTFGENKQDGIYQHKLGHARPLGYGSVKLTLVSTHLRRITGEKGEVSYSITGLDESGIESIACPWERDDHQLPLRIQAMYVMADSTRTMGKTVAYPLGISKVNRDGSCEYAIYEWFSKNRNSRLRTLPRSTDARITLETYPYKKGDEPVVPVRAEAFMLDPKVPENQRIRAQQPNEQNRNARRTDSRPPLRRQADTREVEESCSYAVGQKLEGTVKSFNGSGSAKIAIKGVQIIAFLPRGNRRWDERLKIGQRVQVEVVEYSPDNFRVRFIREL